MRDYIPSKRSSRHGRIMERSKETIRVELKGRGKRSKKKRGREKRKGGRGTREKTLISDLQPIDLEIRVLERRGEEEETMARKKKKSGLEKKNLEAGAKETRRKKKE